MRLARDAAVLDRVYQLRDLPRVASLLADDRGTLDARFTFHRLEAGAAGARVQIRAAPRLECQRCMQAFEHAIEAGSEVEFAESQRAAAVQSEREVAVMEHGHVSLRELAEEELLLALPLAPRCDAPSLCARAPGSTAAADQRLEALVGGPGEAGGSDADDAGQTRRPFSGLQDLLKKT